jgi:hypothetical protein
VQISIAGRRAHLNADTTRAAVQAYLHHVQAHGPEATWNVVANQRGRINKLLYGPPDDRAPGWYCYLATDRSAPGPIYPPPLTTQAPATAQRPRRKPT